MSGMASNARIITMGGSADRLIAEKYCGVPGSPCPSNTGLILARIFNF